MNDEPTSANGRSGDELSWAPPEPKPAGPPQPQPLKGDASRSEPNDRPSPDLGIDPTIEPAVVVSEDAQSEPGGSKKSRVAGAATLGVGAQIGAMQLRPGNSPHGGSPVSDHPVAGPGAHDFPYGPPAEQGVLTSAATKQGILATTTAKVVAGIIAVVAIGAGAIIWGAVAQLGSAGTATETATGTADGGSPASTNEAQPFVFDPKVVVSEGSRVFTTTDAAGVEISLTTQTPVAVATGVQPDIAKKFAAAVGDGFSVDMEERLNQYADLALAECGDTPLGDGNQTTCEREATLTIENAGVYEQYGTVATTSNYLLSSRDRNPQVHSVTMDLETGVTAELADFIDVSDAGVLARAESALQGTQNWAFCQESAGEYLANAQAFSPSEDGVLLLWAIDQRHTAQCGVDQVLVPWANTEETESDDESGSEAAVAPVAEDINGSWCPTAESLPGSSCVTVALPTATYEDGVSSQLTLGMDLGDGGFQFGSSDAPFGGYYPAGTALDLPDYYPGSDVPDQDRIWNSQIGTLYLRG